MSARPTQRGPDLSRLWVNYHAVQRYAEFYPRADLVDLCVALRDGDLLNRGQVERTLRTTRPHEADCWYVLHPERTGVFVVAQHPDERYDHVLTFLRFYKEGQHRSRPVGRPPVWSPLLKPNCTHTG